MGSLDFGLELKWAFQFPYSLQSRLLSDSLKGKNGWNEVDAKLLFAFGDNMETTWRPHGHHMETTWRPHEVLEQMGWTSLYLVTYVGGLLNYTLQGGMVWYIMLWYGMVWYGMVQYGMVWCGMVNL